MQISTGLSTCCPPSSRRFQLRISLVLLLVLPQDCLPLGRLSLQLPLAGSLGLGTLGVHLVLQLLLAGLLSLGAVNVLNKRTLVLEGVTLGEVVQLVVQVLVDLAGGAVLD